MNTKVTRIVCSVHCRTFLLKKVTSSLIIGQVFKKCFWNVCYIYVSWRNLVAFAVHCSET